MINENGTMTRFNWEHVWYLWLAMKIVGSGWLASNPE